MAETWNDPRTRPAAVQYREATEHDAADIAALHADSWRRHYRGAYLDSYLDGDVLSDRIQAWENRLAHRQSNSYTVIADRGGDVIGFAHIVFDEDPKWGALIDNLHVRNDHKKNGIGSQLLSHAATALIGHRPSEPPIHLWVLDQNKDAQYFYEARGGARVETEMRGPFPGGGTAIGHRYFWPDSSQLIVRDTSTSRVKVRGLS